MTAAERLLQLSGLSGVSAGESLKKIAGAAGLAGVLLVSYSGLPMGTAAAHLLTDAASAVRLPVAAGGGGLPLGFGMTFPIKKPVMVSAKLRRPTEEDEALLLAVL